MTEKHEAGYVTQPGFTMPMQSPPPRYDEVNQNPQQPMYPSLSQNLYPVEPAVPSAPPAPPGNMTVVCQPPPHAGPIAVGMQSARIVCPVCRMTVKTVTRCKSQKSAYICCLILCLLGCCLCSCIPHCMRSFQNVHHYCPNCKAFIGTFQS